MSFNSTTFLFLFLPVALGGYVLLERCTHRAWPQAWLLLASLTFYGWANPKALLLFLPSVFVNYWIGSTLSRPCLSGGSASPPDLLCSPLREERDGHLPRSEQASDPPNKVRPPEMRPPGFCGARWLLAAGVIANLLFLGWFKYANFFADNLNALLRVHWEIGHVLLPLGISFFTFMQIAWLVASGRGETVPCNLFGYLLYITFFPQVVSGPIVYQRETAGQFRVRRDAAERTSDFCVGTTLFLMGLCKKVLVADMIAPWATDVFAAVGAGHAVTAAAAWIGALSYTFQLYYDFSGYSDMAIGVARLFGIRLPVNFHSPYKATGISDFWRRWHMTLSRFLRDYLYIPLGGNRCGPVRRSFNLFMTMVLGGLWHGAGWTFLMWGALHGAYLVINHTWTSWRGQSANSPGGAWIARLLTFLAVMVAWIFFRAAQFSDGWMLLRSMGGAGGAGVFTRADPLFAKSVPAIQSWVSQFGVTADPQMVMCLSLLALFVAVWSFPNSQQILLAWQPALPTYGKSIPPFGGRMCALAWRPSLDWLLLSVAVLCWCLLQMTGMSSFLYFDF